MTTADVSAIAQVFAAEEREAIAQTLEKAESYWGFNGNVLVAHKGRIIYEGAVGYADPRTKEEALTNESVYQLASVSKQFTAAAIMLLQQQGKLQYDDPVVEHLPELPYKEMTIRHLLNHTSGLPNHMWLVEHHWHSEEPPTNDDVVELLAKHELPLYFWSGRRHDYSNTGYVVLASVVERLTGQSFASFVKQEIFEPLEMNHSFVYSTASDQNYPERLWGYFRRGWRYRLHDEDIHNGCVGDKGVFSTTEDMLKWDQALYAGELLTPETLEAAFTPAKLRNGREIPYGFGFRLAEEDGKKVVYHNGLWHGFRTSFKRYIEDSVTIIVLNNTNSASKNTVARHLEKVMLKDDAPTATEVVVETVLQKGVPAALEHVQREGCKLNDTQLSCVQEMLVERDKPVLATRFLQLEKELNIVSAEAASTSMTHLN